MAARKINYGAALFGLLIVIALAVLGYSAFQWLAGNTPSAVPPQESPAAAASDIIVSQQPKPVPDKTFADDAGSTHRLTDYKGSYVLVNFWATWCAPCKLELPSLAALKSKFSGNQLKVITISVDKSPAIAAKYLAQNGLTSLDSYTDPSLDLSIALGANALPTTVLIDPASNVIGRHVGGTKWDEPSAVAQLKKIIAKG